MTYYVFTSGFGTRRGGALGINLYCNTIRLNKSSAKEYTGSSGGSKIKMELGQTFLWASCGGLDSIYLRIQPIKRVTSKNRKKVYAISKLQSKGE